MYKLYFTYGVLWKWGLKGGKTMYNNSQSPIMVISGKKAEKMLSKSEKPIADHTKTIDRAKDKLRKMGKK